MCEPPPSPQRTTSHNTSLQIVQSWNSDQVAHFLSNSNLARFISSFKDHHINGNVLFDINHECLLEMGISNVSDRIRILSTIQTLFLNAYSAREPGRKKSADRQVRKTSLPKDKPSNGTVHSPLLQKLEEVDLRTLYIRVTGDEGEMRTVNVFGVTDANSIMSRILQKFNINEDVDKYAIFATSKENGAVCILSEAELLQVCKEKNRPERERLMLKKKHLPMRLTRRPSDAESIRPPSEIIGQDLSSYFPGHRRDRLESFYGRKSIAAPEKWLKGTLLGKGSFGNVYLGLNALTGELMAVKQVELPKEVEQGAWKTTMLEALEHEIVLLKELRHKNIVRYLGSQKDDLHLNIFLEYVPGGSVSALLDGYGPFEESLVKLYTKQILNGLAYLHEKHIMHRDIKGGNVLVDNNGVVKISDFGISKKSSEGAKTKSVVNPDMLKGSVYWMAPEVVRSMNYSKKADIWSVGCLMIEMLTADHPWGEMEQVEAMFKIGTGNIPKFPETTEDVTRALKVILQIDVNKRPTAKEILKDSFFENK